MYIKVAVYIRKSGTREYEKASPKANYPGGTIFCLRYTQGGTRKYEKRSAKIRGDDPIEHLNVVVTDWAERHDPCAVDDDLHRAKCPCSIVE